ncbi:Acylphosphatase [Saliniradius amylolyticus]|uniref:Acylphosphatase n=1 Tax=Saliniradius amylolyticus TaxID=2183582 RepID=A0A2S2E2N4_9ALTE|nr:acylphosphatase [Saliniradius amylolyticus]AWL11849.1 Acylphosphatase [Saliniradius amylolyticus]
MNKNTGIRAIVYGQVQGVFFRKSTQQQAIKLGLTGYAKNLPDGSVEVQADGGHDKLQLLVDYLHRGPEQARVDRVVVEERPAQDYTGFEVR